MLPRLVAEVARAARLSRRRRPCTEPRRPESRKSGRRPRGPPAASRPSVAVAPQLVAGPHAGGGAAHDEVDAPRPRLGPLGLQHVDDVGPPVRRRPGAPSARAAAGTPASASSRSGGVVSAVERGQRVPRAVGLGGRDGGQAGRRHAPLAREPLDAVLVARRPLARRLARA